MLGLSGQLVIKVTNELQVQPRPQTSKEHGLCMRQTHL